MLIIYKHPYVFSKGVLHKVLRKTKAEHRRTLKVLHLSKNRKSVNLTEEKRDRAQPGLTGMPAIQALEQGRDSRFRSAWAK